MDDVRLLDDVALERSSVVANNAMNRERRLTGSNGYGRDLGIDVAELIRERLATGVETFRWLDLCCGSGTALLECARLIDDTRLQITGVDLVDAFASAPDRGVEFVTASVTTWAPDRPFDLITCVHGLHYLGDKLKVLAATASWLAADGLFAANLDLASVRSADARPLDRRLRTVLRAQGFDYDGRRRRITRRGRAAVALPFDYAGADDQAGPNYTGQPAVNSYYRSR
ncbi:class I SAM-dependent methyltransferase [Nocardia goodfellowii]|uniref:SAM-dependent methyltransferase n=1 Tax=Nocardia goodfellowii TaxID=882446 RepID=A0ABS4QSB1_9NOCA|nr:class I SAM-dependent methyltransferase [Nocardia goodfellowii]MBP2193511.1 SAM-dependent methyltransferase [Nocardia goodfellowii]